MSLLYIVAASALGITLGWGLQKGGFCMNTAFRSILFEKDKSLLRAWLLVLVINIPAVTLLTDIGYLDPAVVPFFPAEYFLVLGWSLPGDVPAVPGTVPDAECLDPGVRYLVL